MPNQDITAFARQLDKRQQDCAKLKTSVSENDKVDFFVKNMYDCNLFEAKFPKDMRSKKGPLPKGVRRCHASDQP